MPILIAVNMRSQASLLTQDKYHVGQKLSGVTFQVLKWMLLVPAPVTHILGGQTWPGCSGYSALDRVCPLRLRP